MDFAQEIYDTLYQNKNIQLLTLQAIITQFCFGMFNIIWQPYLRDLNTTYTQLGIIQTILTAFTAIGSLLWGRISDKIGRKPAHIGSIICRIIALAFVISSGNWISFIGFAVFIGLSSSWTQTNPATTTLVSESVSDDKIGAAISIYSSAGTLIAIAAAPLGGYIAVNVGYYIIFLSCLIGELINTLMAQVFLKETLQVSNKSDQMDIWKLFVFEKKVVPFYLIAMLTMFSWRITFSNLNAILVDDYQITPVQLGLMASMFSVSWGISQTPIGTLVDKYPRKLFLIISRIGFLLIPFGYLFSRSFTVFLLLQIINGVAHSFGIPAATSMVLTRVNKEERATVLAKLATFPQIISVPAPLLSGYLYEVVGFSTLLYVRIILVFITLLIAFSIEE